jgi:hypothetical protein
MRLRSELSIQQQTFYAFLKNISNVSKENDKMKLTHVSAPKILLFLLIEHELCNRKI